MEELHWIAARARVGTCLTSACGQRLTRAFYTWRHVSALLAASFLLAENASLASLLANARVHILELREPTSLLW